MTWLLRHGVKFIFYPCIPYERTEFPEAINHYNCPIVTSYAENIKNNVDELQDDSITFRNPFLAFTSEKVLADGLVKEFSSLPEDESPCCCSCRMGRAWCCKTRYAEKRRGNSFSI